MALYSPTAALIYRSLSLQSDRVYIPATISAAYISLTMTLKHLYATNAVNAFIMNADNGQLSWVNTTIGEDITELLIKELNVKN